MEFIEKGNLLEFVNKTGKFDENTAKYYFSQIISVLEYLHNEKQIAHRDIKCENVLLDKYNNIRIIDFGLSNSFNSKSPNMETTCGSPAYAAPEMVLNHPYSCITDIWSTGILLFAICAGYLPFDDSHLQRLLNKILYTEVTYPTFFSSNLNELLSKMLLKDPSSRFNLENIKSHPWFPKHEYFSMTKLLNEEYIGIEKIKEGILDEEIVRKLNNFGIDTSNISEVISKGETNPDTAFYHLLSREKLKELMKDLNQKVKQPLQYLGRPIKQITAPIHRPNHLVEYQMPLSGYAPKNINRKTKLDLLLNSDKIANKQRRLSRPVIKIPVINEKLIELKESP